MANDLQTSREKSLATSSTLQRTLDRRGLVSYQAPRLNAPILTETKRMGEDFAVLLSQVSKNARQALEKAFVQFTLATLNGIDRDAEAFKRRLAF